MTLYAARNPHQSSKHVFNIKWLCMLQQVLTKRSKQVLNIKWCMLPILSTSYRIYVMQESHIAQFSRTTHLQLFSLSLMKLLDMSQSNYHVIVVIIVIWTDLLFVLDLWELCNQFVLLKSHFLKRSVCLISRSFSLYTVLVCIYVTSLLSTSYSCSHF